MDRFRSRRATHRLDDVTADRLIVGQIRPDDAPPGYAAVAALIASARAEAQLHELSGEGAAKEQFTADQANLPAGQATNIAYLAPNRHKAKAAVGLIAGVVLLTGGAVAAATGSLPDSAQRFVHNSVARVGVSIPDGRPASTKGSRVKIKAQDPTTQGRSKGAAVCGTASAGRCQPDKHPSSTTTITTTTRPSSSTDNTQPGTSSTPASQGQPPASLPPHLTTPATVVTPPTRPGGVPATTNGPPSSVSHRQPSRGAPTHGPAPGPK